MKLPKSLFVYHRSPYYIVEICWTIALVAIALTFATQNVSIIRNIFIIIPLILIFYFVAEGIGKIMPLLQKKHWSKALIQFLPYFLGISIGAFVVAAIALRRL